MRALRKRQAPTAEALRVELRSTLAELRLPARSAAAVDRLDAAVLPEAVRCVQALRSALDRLAELIPAGDAVNQPAEPAPVEQPAELDPAGRESVTVHRVTDCPAPMDPPPARPARAAQQRQAVDGMTPTAEQGAIIDACAAGVDLVVEAGAGTGKTTTLRMASSAMKGRRGLYIAYNRAIAQDAKKSFPPHVQCSTAHSLAFRAFGKDYKHRLGVRVPATRTAELLRIVESVRVNDETVLAPAALARLASEAVDKFCHTADAEVTARHVPDLDGITPEEMVPLRREILPYARRLWEETQDPTSAHHYTHDYYLKAWAMSGPRLRADFLLLDEAQDANPVIAALVQAQDAQRIAVGDSAQAIYGWRGAVDALATWPAQQRLYLQQSWRFGPAIAAEANRWLTQIGAPIRLQGNPGRSSRVLAGSLGDRADAVLCRTNAEAMARAMSVLADNRRPALVGGAGQIKDLAQAALDLKAGKPTSHPELLAFSTWEQLRSYVNEEHTGSDLRTFVRLIDDYGPHEVLKAVNSLVEEKYADVIVSTAHKAKGREWDSVLIADDFSEPRPLPTGAPGPIRKDEAMLAYVAVTRAKRALDHEGLAWIDNYG
ncbi:UvrD-helicase domain-containing protein [Streptomyces sp. NPDC053726]|uniref:UvrD-helicase domain-containing protein n=1 Tax=Streptomyces sp. NPDC053726 TaxID=3365713 RepID=UPI0037D0A57A